MADAERIFVGLGANLGDAAASVRNAMPLLGNLPQTTLVAASGLYRSPPLDAAGPDYVNAIAELRSGLAPEALLAQLQSLEQRFGRERPYRHAPRTLDLDLLFYGERHLASASLTLPHPRAHERAFVLAPLADLAPQWRLANGNTVAQALTKLADQRIDRL